MCQSGFEPRVRVPVEAEPRGAVEVAVLRVSECSAAMQGQRLVNPGLSHISRHEPGIQDLTGQLSNLRHGRWCLL